MTFHVYFISKCRDYALVLLLSLRHTGQQATDNTRPDMTSAHHVRPRVSRWRPTIAP